MYYTVVLYANNRGHPIHGSWQAHMITPWLPFPPSAGGILLWIRGHRCHVCNL
jgi:hypothetical protein